MADNRKQSIASTNSSSPTTQQFPAPRVAKPAEPMNPVSPLSPTTIHEDQRESDEW
ncbi:hypothetical protein C8A00DRAFT_34493, partial [Chaetomidium leptoderma]